MFKYNTISLMLQAGTLFIAFLSLAWEVVKFVIEYIIKKKNNRS